MESILVVTSGEREGGGIMVVGGKSVMGFYEVMYVIHLKVIKHYRI